MSGHWENRRYAIVSYPPSAEVWSSVMESPESHRRSVDGTMVVVKWEGTMPPALSGSAVYTNAAVLAILSGPDWTPPDPPPEDP